MGAERPILMLLALHLPSMALAFRYFWRVRRMERALKQRDGLERVHRWASRRSLLLTIWWRDAEAATAWVSSDDVEQLRSAVDAIGGGRLSITRYREWPEGGGVS